jgi:hypothetical protein
MQGMKAFVIAVLLCVCGCAAVSETKFRDDMETWVGADEVELYRGFGQPSGEYVMPNGNRVLFYERDFGVQSRAVAGGTSFLATGSAVTENRRCRIEFEMEKAHVVSWRTQGGYCRD